MKMKKFYISLTTIILLLFVIDRGGGLIMDKCIGLTNA